MKKMLMSVLNARMILALTAFLLTIATTLQAQDYTSFVAGAAGDDAQHWSITTSGHNGTIVCDTWSVRGRSDGTSMVPPFMEVTTDGQRTPLADMQIRHRPVTGLPQGQYRLTMRVRCYDQSAQRLPSGAYVYANGVTENACEDAQTGIYNGQQYTYKVVALTFNVGADGQLDLGINIESANFDWVAWKDVTLTRTDGPLVSGDYVIRHRQTGIYFDSGAMWGTQLVAGTHPRLVSLESAGNDMFYIRMGFDHYGSPAGLKIVDGAAWTDEEATPWTIARSVDGCYTILSATEGTYMGYRDGEQLVAVDLADPANDEAQWEFIPRREMLERLVSATPSSPVDATFLISDPDYDRNAYSDAWVFDTSNHNISGEEGYWNSDGNFCAESWNTSFNVYQHLENIPNGRYQLRVQGLYRYNNRGNNVNVNALTAHEEGYEQLYAKLYANDVETPLQSIVDERDRITELGISISDNPNGGGMPFSMTDASHCFTAGLYDDNVLEVDVVNHQLTVGIRKFEQDGCDWTIWDNFRLIMLQAGDNSDYNYGEQPDDTTDYSDVTPDNPLDMTDRIQNADCEQNSGWRGNPTYGGEWQNRNAEKYFTSFDVYQELKGMPDGWYRLTAQGFYRYGDYFEQQDLTYNGWGELHDENVANQVYAMATVPWAVISRTIGHEELYARLYANEVEAPLPSVFDFAHEEQLSDGDRYIEGYGWLPNSMSAASRAFSDGEYPVELTVYVHDGTLRLGVRKSLGYKNDWAIWDNFHLYYLGNQAPDNPLAESIAITPAGLQRLDLREQMQLSGMVSPALDGYTPIKWTSLNPAVATVTPQGLVTGVAAGSTSVVATLYGLDRTLGSVDIEVCDPSGSPRDIIINEIQVSNIDMFLDPSFNYGGYVELYNPTDKSIPLEGLWLSIDPGNMWQKQLTRNNGYVKAHGYALLWFDHADDCATQHPERMDMDGGVIYLSDASGNLIASQAYPPAVTRTSYARLTDGANAWAFTSYPTPGQSNSESREYLSTTAYERLNLPQVSHESQVFTSAFTLQVEIPAGAKLFYTRDGSTPVAYSSLMSVNGLFSISKTTVLRLLLAKDGMLNSPVKTLTFIKSDLDYTLPVLSIVSNSDNFYDDEIGVFVTGVNGKSGSGQSYNCNWNMEWDRPVAFNYFNLDGSEHYDQEVSLERFGGWSRGYYPYNFKLKAQKQYEGLNYIGHQFFPSKNYMKHKTLQVRNGGNDLLCRIKDVAMQQIIMTTNFHLDCQDYKPVHTFVNGNYLGMLNIREPSNKHFAYANYGIDTDEMDAMELGGGVSVTVGDADDFWRWRNLAYSAYDDATYEQISEFVDIDEFINYMVAETYLGGDDWPGNNCKAFKGNDGKFHIVFFDVDQALRYDSNALRHMTDNSGCPLVQIFLNMLSNNKFRKQFIDTYCLFDGSIFTTERCNEIIDRIVAEMDPALALEGLSTQPTAGYMKQVLTDTRREKMIQSLRNWQYTRLTKDGSHVALQSNVEGVAIRVNGVEVPTGRFDGTLFAPTVLTATAPEGYQFRGWQDADGVVYSESETYDISDMGDIFLTATYEPLPSDNEMLADLAMPLKVNEVSAGNTVFVNEQFKKNDWVELYNPTDTDLNAAGLYLSDDPDQPLKYQVPQSDGLINTIVPAHGHLVLWADKLESESQLHTGFKLGNNDGEVVIITSSDEFVANNPAYFNSHPQMKAFADGMTYVAHRGDQTIGRYPDGGRQFYCMWRPTIDRSNTLLPADQFVGEDQPWMIPQTESFTLDLAEGWNWTSHLLDEPVSRDDLSPYAQRILGFDSEAYRDANRGLVGTLTQLEAGKLYKVQMSQADSYTANGALCDSRMPIGLKPGWNWIGYTANGSQTLSNALAGNLLDNGDVVMGQDGFSTYRNGSWSGTLSTVETGKGYLFKSTKTKTLRFNEPAVQVRMRHPHRSPLTSQFSLLKTAYPNQMGLIAQLSVDGQYVNDPDRFVLQAYAGDECRGQAQWLDDLLWLSVYGDGGEAVTFKVVDQYDGSVYEAEERTSFVADLLGSIDEPFQLSLTTYLLPTSVTDAQHTASSVLRYFDLQGRPVGSRAVSLPSGVYVAKMSDGSYRKIHIQ